MRFLIILCLIAFSCSNNNNEVVDKSTEPVVKEDNFIDGEKLYKGLCGNCHKCHKDFAGPALKGSLERWGYNKKAMYAFIRNPAKSITENAYAKKHYEKWKAGGLMTAFPQLRDKELDAIMSYCDFIDFPPQK